MNGDYRYTGAWVDAAIQIASEWYCDVANQEVYQPGTCNSTMIHLLAMMMPEDAASHAADAASS